MTKTPEQMAKEYVEQEQLEYDEAGGAYYGFLAGYKAAHQWISVEDRLPEEGQMCVVQSNWHGVLLSERIEDRWLLKEDDGHYERPTHWVTHWMPLPSAPKEEA